MEISTKKKQTQDEMKQKNQISFIYLGAKN